MRKLQNKVKNTAKVEKDEKEQREKNCVRSTGEKENFMINIKWQVSFPVFHFNEKSFLF